jgi:iron complex outermembrane recepter protein
MKSMTTRERLLASTMIFGVMATAAATPTLAQTTTAAPPAGANGGQVVIVTGSRIPVPNLKSISPVTVVNSTEVKLQGTIAVETLLNNLPQVYGNQGGGSSNGASGTATVNLRDLGPPRTLVLVDGTRLPPADVVVPAPDLDTIPSFLVDRIEVLTGGASATYGSDAVAGVVNFIMKHDLEGVRIDAEFGAAQDSPHDGHMDLLERTGNAGLVGGDPALDIPPIRVPGSEFDGFQKDVNVAIGVNSPDEKGNIEAYVGYRSIDALTQDKRDYTACAIFTNNGDDNHYCGGSSNVPQGKFVNANPGGGPTEYGTPTGLSPVKAPAFNYAPFNYLQRPQERYSAGYFAHYEFNPHVDVYSSLMFSDNHTFAQIAPSGLFQGPTYQVNCTNPYLIAAGGGPGGPENLCVGATGNETDLVIGRRTVELGNRTDDLRHTAYRLNLGVKGDIAEGWTYDAYIQYADTIYQEEYTGEVSVSHVREALQAVAGPGGTVVCAGGQAGCVPINIFQSGALTPAMLSWISGTGEKEGNATEQIASFSVTGDLGQYGLKSPFANEGVGVALGAEYRREAIDLNPDEEFTTGDLAGQGGQTAPVHGAYDAKEVFGEVRVPIAEKQPFFDLLSVDGGYRYSDYSSVGGTNTYKIGGEWGPVPDIHFRASYNRAVRAPNTVELFSAPALKLFSGSDPCAGGVPGSASPAGCIAQGVLTEVGTSGLGANGRTAYGFVIPCPAGQCESLSSGNPHLGPETADTKTFGVVFTPTFFKGFTASVDYFDINVMNLVGAYGAATVVNACMNDAADGNPNAAFFCGMIHRDPTDNVIFAQNQINNLGNLSTMFANGSVNNFNVNTGYLHTTGIDFEADYRTKFSDWGLGEWGGLALHFDGTWTGTFQVQPSPKIGSFDCAGLFGPQCSNAVAAGLDGGPIPKWRHMFRVTWTTPWDNLTVSVDWRHISGVKPEFSSGQKLLDTGANGNASCPGTPYPPVGGGCDAIDNIGAYDYMDLSLIWRVKNGVTLRAGMNNVFDRDPPVVDQSNLALSAPPIGNGNTFPSVYDALGRTMFIGLTADF